MDERQIAQLEIIKNKVRGILGGDPSGHADDHVERVALLAERFTSECNEPVDLYEVLLTAWLHDIDDYKLVGKADRRVANPKSSKTGKTSSAHIAKFQFMIEIGRASCRERV